MSDQHLNQTAGTGPRKKAVGHEALTAEEKKVLSWSPAERLAEFQRVNPNTSKPDLEAKLLFIESMALDNGEILDVLRVNPKTRWQIVRDMFTGGVVDGYTSTFHSLDDINYPEHFWKAIIENEREKLLKSG